MKNVFLLVCLITSSCISYSQDLYVKTFGDKHSKPLIFLHGGPGYNAAGFEITTAGRLADSGYFVIVYDRRGEGRSVNAAAAYTFRESFDDLNSIYKTYSLNKATLIGHSFGGMLSVLFAEQYPDKVNEIILVGAPVSLQESYRTIINRSKQIYERKKDSINQQYISLLEKMDSSSLDYSTYCFAHAMQNGFYTPKKFSDEAKQIYTSMRKNPLVTLTSQMTVQPPTGFWKNEHYTTLDLYGNIRKLAGNGTKVYGIYGKEDGLYSEQQVSALASIIGGARLSYLDNCSHSVFIDQQSAFVETLIRWTK